MKINRLAAILVAVVLTGCAGTHFEWDRAKQVKIGTPEAEVIELMGKPYMIRTVGDKQRWVWSYASGFTGTRFVSFELKDGKVSGVPNMDYVE